MSASSKTTPELQSIARALGKGTLHLKDASSKTTAELQSIARAASDRVTFEF